MRRKLGLIEADDRDASLVKQLFDLMQQDEVDFTSTFRQLARLADDTARAPDFLQLFKDTPAIEHWLASWHRRLADDPQPAAERAAGMRRVNPAFIPRNHRVEQALEAATAGDLEPFHRLLGILARPFDEQPGAVDYERPPAPSERVLQTFCGT